MKVAMLLDNSFTNDKRVYKEAQTLVKMVLMLQLYVKMK